MSETLQETKEILAKEIAEDMLIQAYVPDAEYYSHEDALKLALERDAEAANELAGSCLNLEGAVEAIREPELEPHMSAKATKAFHELGY